MPDQGGVAEALTNALRAKEVEVLRIDGAPDADTLTRLAQELDRRWSDHGVYWLPALDHEGSLRNMDLSTWHECLRVRVKSLYADNAYSL